MPSVLKCKIRQFWSREQEKGCWLGNDHTSLRVYFAMSAGISALPTALCNQRPANHSRSASDDPHELEISSVREVKTIVINELGADGRIPPPPTHAVFKK